MIFGNKRQKSKERNKEQRKKRESGNKLEKPLSFYRLEGRIDSQISIRFSDF